jgi:LuxR family maltose regulon positive regulatory protein
LTAFRCETYAVVFGRTGHRGRLAAQFEQDITLAAVPEFIALSMVSIAWERLYIAG